jgi:predicted nucleic acid-binding protein
MNGNNIVVDTNVLIYLLEGKRNVDEYLRNNYIFISVITENGVTGLV